MPKLLLNDRRTDHVVGGIKFQPDIPVEVDPRQLNDGQRSDLERAVRRHTLIVADDDADEPAPKPKGSDKPKPKGKTDDKPKGNDAGNTNSNSPPNE